MQHGKKHEPGTPQEETRCAASKTFTLQCIYSAESAHSQHRYGDFKWSAEDTTATPEKKVESCDQCLGSGEGGAPFQKCGRCDGTGRLPATATPEQGNGQNTKLDVFLAKMEKHGDWECGPVTMRALARELRAILAQRLEAWQQYAQHKPGCTEGKCAVCGGGRRDARHTGNNLYEATKTHDFVSVGCSPECGLSTLTEKEGV